MYREVSEEWKENQVTQAVNRIINGQYDDLTINEILSYLGREFKGQAAPRKILKKLSNERRVELEAEVERWLESVEPYLRETRGLEKKNHISEEDEAYDELLAQKEEAGELTESEKSLSPRSKKSLAEWTKNNPVKYLGPKKD